MNRQQMDAKFARMNNEEKDAYLKLLAELVKALQAARVYDSPGKQRIDGAKLMGVKFNTPSVN